MLIISFTQTINFPDGKVLCLVQSGHSLMNEWIHMNDHHKLNSVTDAKLISNRNWTQRSRNEFNVLMHSIQTSLIFGCGSPGYVLLSGFRVLTFYYKIKRREITCFFAQWQSRHGHMTYMQPIKCFCFEPWRSDKDIFQSMTSHLKNPSVMLTKVFPVIYKFLE